jgi:uncharacterized protein (DUF58 family)
MRRWHDWTDPDFFQSGDFKERRVLPLFLRQILPKHLQRTKLTLIGWLLILVALGIGTAAYNTSSNILFMTLSLLLSSLVLSGLLSQINFHKLSWTLHPPEHLQVDENGMAEVVLRNQKRIFPSMCIALQAGGSEPGAARRLYLEHALAAGQTSRLEWTFVPERRGRYEVSINGLESMFPFGFIRKVAGRRESASMLVWPARVDYSFGYTAGGRRFLTGASKRRAGTGSDLLNLRHYEKGDPPRLIHWKASARLNKLMTRQLAQEGESGYHICLDPAGADWSEPQFERLCSLVCALSEDLFRAGRLETVVIAGGDMQAVRSLRDLHGFFDQLALLEPAGRAAVPRAPMVARPNSITFKPRGESGLAIHVDGTQAGQA